MVSHFFTFLNVHDASGEKVYEERINGFKDRYECRAIAPSLRPAARLVEYLRSSIVPMLCDPAEVMAQAQQRMRASDPRGVTANSTAGRIPSFVDRSYAL